MRSATTSGCSTKLVRPSMTPGDDELVLGQRQRLETPRPHAHGADRRKAARRRRPSPARSTGQISSSGTRIMRRLVIAPADMHAAPGRADVDERRVDRRTTRSTKPRNSPSGRSMRVLRSSARSGQSSCSRNPSPTMASYSTLSAAAERRQIKPSSLGIMLVSAPPTRRCPARARSGTARRSRASHRVQRRAGNRGTPPRPRRVPV